MRRAGAVLMVVVAAAGVAEASVPTGDAHVIRRPRGDIVEVRGDLPDAAYVAPETGWRYAPVRVGDRLRPAFTAPRYVVADPVALPRARGHRKWVRYGEDLLLVDVRDGRVTRVVPGRYRPDVRR